MPDPTLAYNAGDAAVGDLDGDGKYELVIRRDVEPRDPGPAENWVGKEKGSTLYEAYDLKTGAFCGESIPELMYRRVIIMLRL